MRHIIIRQPRHIAPFNEPASRLTVLNRTVGEWQRELLAPHCDAAFAVNDFDELPRGGESVVTSDNLWFDHAFLKTFLLRARDQRQPARAAFDAGDRAYLQHGLARISRSAQRHGDLVLLDLWYFPDGVTQQVEPIVIASGAREADFYPLPPPTASEGGERVWWLPERAAVAVDTWVHLLVANVIFGALKESAGAESRFARRRLWPFRRQQANGGDANPNLKKGRNCRIHPSAVFDGPVTLGDDVTVGPGCVVSHSVIGSGVTLAGANHLRLCVTGDGSFFPPGASADCSTVMAGTTVGANATVELSVLGRDSAIGGGTVFSTAHMLPKPIEISAGLHAVELDVPALGGCVGHNCRVGPGMVIMPGRTVESDVILTPSPERRVIMQDIRYEESDHHARPEGYRHSRLYPRVTDQLRDAEFDDEGVLEAAW